VKGAGAGFPPKRHQATPWMGEGAGYGGGEGRVRVRLWVKGHRKYLAVYCVVLCCVALCCVVLPCLVLSCLDMSYVFLWR
jgi:hypothetical protein